MITIFRGWILTACIGAIAFAHADEGRREHAAHEHGSGVGSLAEDSGRWQLMLELPGYNLVGFEHPPRNEQQARRLQVALARLESGQWLQPAPGSGCRVASSRVETIGYAASDGDAHTAHAGDAHDHNQNHDHDEDHNHAEASRAEETNGGHGAFHISAVISCDESRRLRWLDIALFEGFPDNHSIRIDVLSDSGAASERLDSENFRIRFD